MLRRKFFAYVVMMVSGILIAYYLCECSKILISFGILFCIFAIIRNVDVEVRDESTLKEKFLLVLFLVLGFALFTSTYISMNKVLQDSDGEAIASENVSSISGRVVSIKTKDDGYKFVIDNTSIKGTRKVEASYYNELACENDMYDLLGESVTLYGKLKEPTGQENPGCFNYKVYQYSKGIRFNFTANSMKTDSSRKSLYWLYKKAVCRCRDSFLSEFDEKPEIRAFVKGVIFGDKSELNDETIEEFNDNSTGHILAVSGLHIGFLFALLRFLTKKSRSKASSALIIIVLFLYGEMTAWSPSTVRATLVLSINLLAIYAKRTPDLLTSVSAAAFAILTWNPYMLFNSGFQMSFMALLGLVFFADPLQYFIGKYFAPLIAIQLSVAPILAFSFNRFNFITILINIPIVYLASILVPICIVSLCVMIMLGALPGAFRIVVEFISNLIIKVNSILNFDGMFSVNIKSVNVGLLLGFYLVAFFVASEWFRVKVLRKDYGIIKKMGICLIVLSLLIGIGSYNKFLNDEIVFVSVGQGDCTHIRCGGRDVFIDGGGSKDFNVAKNTLSPYLLKNGASNLDAGIVTHLHTDHFLGIFQLNEIFNVKSIVIPNMYKNAGEGENSADFGQIKNLCMMNPGEEIKLADDVYIKSIWPAGSSAKLISSDDANENNMVYLVFYRGIKIMVTGDLVSEDEEKMIDYYKGSDVLDCVVLKVGHHGSKTSSSEEFLDAVTPEIAVISVGANNMYGHPDQETLDKLAARGIRTYRTDLNGAVGIDIDSTGIEVDTMR